MNLVLDTPDDILEYSEKELLELCDPGDSKIPMKTRLIVIKALFRAMKLEMTPDVALAVISEPRHKLIIACAGSGKSTTMQANIIRDKALYYLVKKKILYGTRILFLAYNTSNVGDITNMQSNMVNMVKKANIGGIELDAGIDSRTFHSFCLSWFEEYREFLGYGGMSLETDDNAFLSLITRSMDIVKRKQEIGDVDERTQKDILNLFRMSEETFTPLNSEKVYSYLSPLPCSLEVLELWYRAYTSLKKMRKIFDYTDVLVGFNRLCRENEGFLERVKINYHSIYADECQDLNPIMIDSLQVLSKYCKIVMIGDEDQTIYAFRGADYEYLTKFREYFEGGKIYSMFYNRRCRAMICDLAKYIVSKNTRRFNKNILPMKPGGEVELVGYGTESGQLLKIVNILSSKSPEDLSKVAIGTKENIHTAVLTQLLEDHRIQLNVKRGFLPYSHELFMHYETILTLVESPFDPYTKKELFKLLPATRSEIKQVFYPDGKTLDFDVARKHFAEVDYGILENRKGFREVLKNLETISAMARREPVQNWIDALINIFYTYYWNSRLKMLEESNDTKRLDVYHYFTKRVHKEFKKPLVVRALLNSFNQRKSTVKNISDVGYGVTIGTLHSFKGAEADEFHIIYMDADVFPNVEINSRTSEIEALKLRESETFLAYVAFTRAREKLYLHYNMEKPSLYATLAKEFLEQYQPEEIFVPQMDLMSREVSTERRVDPRKGTDPNKGNLLSTSFAVPDIYIPPTIKKEPIVVQMDEDELDLGTPKSYNESSAPKADNEEPEEKVNNMAKPEPKEAIETVPDAGVGEPKSSEPQATGKKESEESNVPSSFEKEGAAASFLKIFDI